jgi:hypothetical protein
MTLRKKDAKIQDIKHSEKSQRLWILKVPALNPCLHCKCQLRRHGQPQSTELGLQHDQQWKPAWICDLTVHQFRSGRLKWWPMQTWRPANMSNPELAKSPDPFP